MAFAKVFFEVADVKQLKNIFFLTCIFPYPSFVTCTSFNCAYRDGLSNPLNPYSARTEKSSFAYSADHDHTAQNVQYDGRSTLFNEMSYVTVETTLKK